MSDHFTTLRSKGLTIQIFLFVQDWILWVCTTWPDNQSSSKHKEIYDNVENKQYTKNCRVKRVLLEAGNELV